MQAAYRQFPIGKRQYDPDTRELSLTWSSDAPVSRSFGDEILDHSTSANIRLDRLRKTKVVLWQHDPDQLIGNIRNVEIDSDGGIGRADIVLGVAGKAREVADNIESGVYPSVSVGYRIHKAIREEIDEEENVYRVTDWEPFEISLVTIPADVDAQIHRSTQRNSCLFIDDDEVRKMKTEDKREDKAEAAKTPAEPKAEVVNIDEVRRKAQREAGQIYALGEKWKQQKAAQRWLDEGKDLAGFREYLLDNTEFNSAPEVREAGAASTLDLTPKEQRDYSIVRGLQAQVNKDWRKAGFELECSQTIAERLGRSPRGMYVPMEIQGMRAAPMGGGKAAEGAELVGTTHLASSFIEHLYSMSVILPDAPGVTGGGATVLNNLTANIAIPRQDSSATQAFVADEHTGVTAEALATGTLSLSPKVLAGAVSMGRLLLKQSDPSVEAMVRRDLARGAALAIDDAALEGAGSGGAPEGVINATGVNTETITTPGQPTWADLVNFEIAVMTDNALMGDLFYWMTPAVLGFLKITIDDAGSGVYLAQGMSTNGYPIRVSTTLAANTIIFGDVSQIIAAFWGDLDVQADTATLASAGGLVLRSFLDCDIGVRHPVAFCINA